MNNEKVRIENAADLFKLPINLIKNTKIYNFHGKYFDKIYEEAMKIERNGGVVDGVFRSRVDIRNIIFEIKFKTEFGQRISVSGSTSHLGNWDINETYIKFYYLNLD
jgi:hypothetical protein